MARQKTKICVSCNHLFRGRQDARTCSERCRKRLQRAKLLVEQDVTGVINAGKAIIVEAESKILPFATDEGFVGSTNSATSATPQTTGASPNIASNLTSPSTYSQTFSPIETYTQPAAVPVAAAPSEITSTEEITPPESPSVIPSSLSSVTLGQTTTTAGLNLTNSGIPNSDASGVAPIQQLDAESLEYQPGQFSYEPKTIFSPTVAPNADTPTAPLESLAQTVEEKPTPNSPTPSSVLTSQMAASKVRKISFPYWAKSAIALTLVISLVAIGTYLLGSQKSQNQTSNQGSTSTVNGQDFLPSGSNVQSLQFNKAVTIDQGASFTATGQVLFKNLANSEKAFNVQNVNGDSLITVNTVNNTVTIVGLQGSGALLTNLNASNLTTGSIPAGRLPAGLTLQGNSFNGASQLVQLTGGSALPALNGSNLTNVDALTLQGNSAAFFTNASNISSGTLSDARLAADVTLQGNSFNGVSQLVQLTAGGVLPALGASSLINLNASNVSLGTLSDARLSGNVALLDGIQTFTGNDTFSNTIVVPSITNVNSGHNVTLGFTGSATGNVNYTLDRAVAAGTYAVCTVAGNCVGLGGAISGSGTNGTIALFSGSSSITDSILTQSGSVITAAGSLNVTGQYQVGGSQIASSNLSDSSNIAKLNGTGPQTFSGNNKFTGTVLLQNAADSTAAFQVKNLLGNELLTVDTSGSQVVLGKASTLSGSLAFYNASGAGAVSIVTANPGASSFTITLPAATGTVCLTTGNCAGVGGGVTTVGGTTNKLAKFSGSQTIADSIISDNGTTATVTGNLAATAISQNGNTVCDVSGNCAGVGGQIGGSGTSGTVALFSGTSTIGNSVITQSGSALTFAGTALFKNASNSTIAFQIQDSSSNNYLLVNTLGASMSVGDTGTANTIQIGNTTGAVAQTINIGNNATSSSSTTLTIGSTISGSTVSMFGGGNSQLVLTGAASTKLWSDSSRGLSIIGHANSSLLTDSGNFDIDAASTLTLGTTNAANITAGSTTTTGTLTLGQSTAGETINIANGAVISGRTNAINIATAGVSGSTTNINIGSIYGGSTTLQGGTGGINIGTANVSNTIQIGNVAIANTQTINIGNNAVGGSNITAVLGSTIGSSTTTIQAGTGNLNLTTNSASASIIAKSQTNSATAFQIQNSSAGVLFSADTKNMGLAVGNLQSTGSISLQNSQGAGIQLRTVSASGSGLTLSGNEITDKTRTAATQGDGRQAPDSSTGIWEATTNLAPLGGAEGSITNYYVNNARMTPSQATNNAKFGSNSFKAVGISSGDQSVEWRNEPIFGNRIPVTAGQTYTFSLWQKSLANYGRTTNLQVVYYDSLGVAGAPLQNTTTSVSSATTTYGRVSYTTTAPTGAQSARFIWTATAGATGETYYFDGVQVENKAYATPYVETNGATASRSAARVQAPAADLNSTQGWVAIRARTSWASGSAPSSYPTFFTWGDDANNKIILYYGNGSQFNIDRVASGSLTTATKAASFSAGDTVTLIIKWTSTTIGVSFNGSTFTNQSNTNIPTLAASLFDIGSGGTVLANNYSDSDILWAQAGTGTLSDADATTLNSYGNSDPTISQLNSLNSGVSIATFSWDGNDSKYSGAESSFVSQSSISLDDVSLTHSANGSLAVQGSTNSTTAFQIQNASAASVFTIDTVNGGLLTLQAASSLTSGQSHVTDTFTNGSSTGGTINGYKQTITVSNTSSASTTNGINIALTDNTSLANTDKGISISLGGSNTAEAQYGVDVSVNKGYGIRAISSGYASGAGADCIGNGSGLGAAVCADSTSSSNSVGIISRTVSGSGGSAIVNATAGNGIISMNSASGGGTQTFAGVRGQALQSAASTYTSIGVIGEVTAGSGATTYGGYFSLITGSGATLGSALYASNSTVGANILQLQDNTSDVFVVGDGGSVAVTPSDATKTISLGSTTQTGTITLGQYNGASTSIINVGNNAGASSTQQINIAASGSGINTVTIGSTTLSSTTNIQGGTGTGSLAAVKIQPNVAGDILIGASAATGTFTLGSSSSANNIIIAGGAGASAVTIANVQNGGSVAIGAGMTTGTFTAGGVATTGTITLGQSTASNEIDLGNANTTTGNIQTIKIGAGTGVGTGKSLVTIGSTANASATTIQGGTGGLLLTPSGTTNTGVTVKPGTDSTAAFQIQNSSSLSFVNADTTNGQLAVSRIASGYSDEFGSGSHSNWSFVTNDSSTSDFNSSNVGKLTITTNPASAAHDCWTGGSPTCLREVETAPASDFVAETKIDTKPGNSGQALGILIYKDSTNFIRYEWNGTGGIDVHKVIANVGTASVLTANSGVTSAPAYLKVTRIGNVWTFYYSTDGASWVTLGSINLALDLSVAGAKVGVHLTNTSGSFTAGTFDYFRLTIPMVVAGQVGIQQNDTNASTTDTTSAFFIKSAGNNTLVAADTLNLALNVGSTSNSGATAALNVYGTSLVRGGSTTEFQVQNSTGVNVFNIDTTNGLVGTAATSTASTNSQAFSLQTGNATGSTSNSGSLTIDVGTATGTAGTISIGTANTPTINIGSVGSTNKNTTIHIADSSAGVQTITIGTTNSTSGTNIQAGTGRITLTGQIKVAQSGTALSNTNLAESGAGSATLGTGSTDTAGSITTSTTSHTTVTLTFGATMTNAPFCVISPGNGAAATINGSGTSAYVTTTATTMVINTAADTSAAQWIYHCFTR